MRIKGRLQAEESITPETKAPKPMSAAQVMQVQAAPPEVKTGSTRASTAFVPVSSRKLELKERKKGCTIL